MSNLSNCFSYLGINFYEKEIPEKIPKNFNLFIKFLHALDFSYALQFSRNMALLHNSTKFCQQVPTLDKIYRIFEANFIKKAVNSKCFFIKNWNEDMIYFLVWLISVCEILFYKSFYEFTSYEWQIISNLLPKSDSESLKYKWFTLISSVRSPEWSREEDEILLSILRKTDSNLFVPGYSGLIDIKWSKVALDLSKTSSQGASFKTSKQCRERWLNHLNPFLNKETWTAEEDIKLLEESLAKSKSWSEISKIFPGRTQHTVKNRFLAVMGKEMVLSRTAIRSLLKKQNNEQLIMEVLKKLHSAYYAPEETKEKDILPIESLKRTKQQAGIESPCFPTKRNKFSRENDESMNNETQSVKLTQYEGTPMVENNNNNLIEMLADKFNFWKEGEEEPEKKSFFGFGEEKEPTNAGSALFNVDDFFSL